MSHETKVGFFLLASLAVILSSVLFLGKVRFFKGSTSYHLDFANVEALPPKAAVKIAGVEVGKVDRVRLVNGRARVTVDIDRSIVLHENAKIRVASTGIIGSRYIEIDPGGEPAAVLKEGDTIVGQNGTSIESMLTRLSTLFDDDAEHGNAVDNLKATLANIRNVTDALDQAMGHRAADLERIVVNIRDLSQSAKVVARNLEEITTENKDDIKIALEKFRGAGEKLDAILAKIQSGEGTIGALVSDQKTADEVKETISSIRDTAFSAKRTLGRVGRINTYWSYRFRYDTRDEENKSDIGIKLVPRPGKFYSFGATNVGEYESKNKVFERKNAITAVMGADLGPFSGYAGAIRSSGGVGLNFRPFWFNRNLENRVELSAEAYEFSRDRVIQDTPIKGTVLDTGLRVALTSWWWVGVRSEDVLERSRFQLYTNIIFRDEDLAALLGIAAIAR